MRRTSTPSNAVSRVTPSPAAHPDAHASSPGLRVLVVDARRAMAEAIAFKLNGESDIGAVAIATTWNAFLTEVEIVRPQVVIADLEHDDVALRVLRHVAGRRPPVDTVVITESGKWAAAAVRGGARGVYSPSEPADRLADVVRGVVRGETHVPPRLLTTVVSELTNVEPTEWELRIRRLTARERDVIALMVAGLTKKAIADELYLSVNTVRTHVKNILSKLEVHSSLEAVSVALRAGVRAPGDPAIA